MIKETKKIRIGLAQMNSTVGDLRGNTRKIKDTTNRAMERGIHILAFPEFSLCGYPPEDLLLDPRFLKDCEQQLLKLAEELKGITVLIGSPQPAESTQKKPFNTCCVLHGGEIAARYRKIMLPNYGVYDEMRYFSPGDRALVLIYCGGDQNYSESNISGKAESRINKEGRDRSSSSGSIEEHQTEFKNRRDEKSGKSTKGDKFESEGEIRVGINICEDIWMDNGPTPSQTVDGGAGIIINISASPYHRGKCHEREELMKRRARENSCHICYVNLVGGQDELVFDGSSVIVSPHGKTITRARPFEEELLIADLDPSSVNLKNPGIKAELSSSFRLEFVRLPLSRERKKGRDLSYPLPEYPGALEEVYAALTLGTRDYVYKNGFNHVVLGLSGGIDSALTATIAVDALGSERVTVVTMPSDYTSKESSEDAAKLAENLHIDLIDISIENIYHSYLDSLEKIRNNDEIGVTEENIQARIRGNILMALSNKYGWLVLTTGNKSELAVGYCTLYGDMAGGFAVLKDVPKTLVYSLSRYRNKIAEADIIPPAVIERKPSAELRPGQYDQDTLPPYKVLDRIIEMYVENNMEIERIISEGPDRETIMKVIHMIDTNEYKRRQAPPGIKITPKAFGRDRRLPITNLYKRSKE